MQVEEAFLIGINSRSVRRDLAGKIDRGEPLSDEDMMKLIIYPLTYKGRKAQEEAVTEAVDIAERIEEESTQRTVLSGIYVFADKIITDKDAQRIIRRQYEVTSRL